MRSDLPRRKARALNNERSWKLSAVAVGIPVCGWLAVLLLSRVLLRCGWIGSDQAAAMCLLPLLSAPVHVLVVLFTSTLGLTLSELAVALSWRALGAIVATAAPVFVAITTTNMVLNDGSLSPAQVMIGAVAAHVTLVCVVPLLGMLGGRGRN